MVASGRATSRDQPGFAHRHAVRPRVVGPAPRDQLERMQTNRRNRPFRVAITAAVLWLPQPTLAADAADAADEKESGAGSEEGDNAGLAKQTQNPVADLVSVPFQNNTTYNIGPNARASNALNIQPVIP